MCADFKTKECQFLQNLSLWIGTIFLTLILNLNFSLELYARTEDIKFEKISLEQGLSQATVWAIIQDSYGFMWFGTADGLNKYDGYSFTVYNHDPSDSTSLSDGRIFTIYEDKSGTLWIGTSGGGLNKFDRENEKFTHYKHDPFDPNSLSNDRVMSIYEDRSGTLWIGTAGGGLNRFNREAERFECFKHDQANQNSLSNDHVFPIFEDKTGALWIGTIDGLNKLVTPVPQKAGPVPNSSGSDSGESSPTFTHYKHDPAIPHSLSHSVINAIYEDKSGTLWIGTDEGLNKLVRSPDSTGKGLVSPISGDSGLSVRETDGYDGTKVKWVHYKHDPTNPNSLSDNMIWSIYEDRSGTLWIGTAKGGLNKFDRDKETFIEYKHDPSDQNSLSDNRVRCIFEDEAGVLWIGTNGGGLNKINRSKEKFAHYKNDPANPNSLSNNRVYSIYQDRADVFWIGTSGGGLNRFDREKETFVHYKNDPSNPVSLSYDIVLSICEDKSGALWIGTSRGGLNKFDREKEIFVHYKNDPSNPNSLSDNSVRCMFADKSGALWIGTNGGGLNKLVLSAAEGLVPSTGSGQALSEAKGLVPSTRSRKESEQSAWAPGYSAGSPPTFVRYRHNPDDPNSLSNDMVRSIYGDHLGTLWIGTYGGGLDKLALSEVQGREEEREVFVHYKHDPSNPNSLSNNYVLSIYEDPADMNGTLWIGTSGGGLNRFDRAKEEFTYFTDKDGLANNVVYGILGDDHGNLWLSTNKGLSKFSPQTGKFRNYDVNDGLQSNEFNTGAYYESRSGEMFFGGINGFNAFYPDSIKDNPYIPPIVITVFKKFDEIVKFDISGSEEIELSYKDKYLAFEFVALDYTNPQKNQYAYMMTGFDEDWNYSGTRRFATYTNMDPGEYVFSVKGSNSDGVWNEEGVSIKIVITPPFWQTWWFFLLSAVSLTAIGYTLYRRRLNAKIEKVRFLNELTAAHDMQMGLMPKSDPIIEGFDIAGICKPAEAVGGDYFDYVWVDEEKTKLGIAVVDVSEKAMKGAMTAVLTSGMIYREPGCGESPPLVLHKLNRAMYLKTDSRVFTTMLYGVIDIKSRMLALSNAGQPQPILMRRGQIRHIKGDENHLPLGVQEDVEYAEVKVKLHSGDVVIFYTDGLPEAMNDKNELFDVQRLETAIYNLSSTIRSAEIIKTLLEEVKKFTGTTRPHDDITMVVVRVL